MYEYFVKKEYTSIEDIKDNCEFEGRLFCNDGLDNDKKYADKKFNRCTFSKVSFNKITVSNTEFNFTVFIDCYFNYSVLENIKFKNCLFIKCKFNKMKIEKCDFFYTEWEKCYIKFDTIKSSLPDKSNYRKKLCKTMAQNCLEDNNEEEYKKFFFEYTRARENHYKKIIKRKEKYYKNNYTWKDSLKYSIKLLMSKLSGLVWGYGEKVINLIISSILIILTYAGVYYCVCTNGINNLEEAFRVSLAAFFNIDSGVEFVCMYDPYLHITEYALGLIFVGMFVAYIFRDISKRS